MKAHKVVLVFVDLDEIGAEEAKDVLENARYPNRCMAPEVLDVQTVDIGEWSDDHPLNSSDPELREWERYFPPADAQPPAASQGMREAVEDERAAFRAWWGTTHMRRYEPDSHGGMIWEAWQARAALSRSQEARSTEAGDWGETFMRLGCDLARAEKQYRECLPAQVDRAREIMREAGDRWRDHIDSRASGKPQDPATNEKGSEA